jgi:hypothetical protein
MISTPLIILGFQPKIAKIPKMCAQNTFAARTVTTYNDGGIVAWNLFRATSVGERNEFRATGKPL